MKYSRVCSVAAVLACGFLGSPLDAIVTANPATAGPPENDPHVVDGPVDVRSLVPRGPARPLIYPDGIVEITLVESDGTARTCSGAVVSTPQGPQPRGVLTAAHCATIPQLVQVTAQVLVLGNPELFETCHLINDPGCDLDDFIYVHPLYVTALSGYDLALVYFENPITHFTTSYNVAPVAPSLDDLGTVFFKFGYGCHGYGGDGVDIFDPSVYDHILRVAANAWKSNGLGSFGVTVCNNAFTNNETQLVSDFDRYDRFLNNLFNYYLHTFDPDTGWIDYSVDTPHSGVVAAEGWGCPGDSGGPNFFYDDAAGQWYIAAVNSYVLRMDDDWGPFQGNSDLNSGSCSQTAGGRDMSFGEYEGDALVTEELIDQVLGLAPPPGVVPTWQTPSQEFALGTAPAPGPGK